MIALVLIQRMCQAAPGNREGSRSTTPVTGEAGSAKSRDAKNERRERFKGREAGKEHEVFKYFTSVEVHKDSLAETKKKKKFKKKKDVWLNKIRLEGVWGHAAENLVLGHV